MRWLNWLLGIFGYGVRRVIHIPSGGKIKITRDQ